MEFISTRFGPIEIDPAQVITFPQGLHGFEACTRYKLVHEDKDTPLVFFLQSLDDPDLSLTLMDPCLLDFRYEIGLTDEEAALMKIEQTQDVAILLTLAKTEVGPTSALSAGMRSPILINVKSMIGLQKAGLTADIVFRTI